MSRPLTPTAKLLGAALLGAVLAAATALGLQVPAEPCPVCPVCEACPEAVAPAVAPVEVP